MEQDVAEFWRTIVPRWLLGELIFFVADRRIADLIGRGREGAAVEKVAAQANLNAEALRRVLRALAAHGIFRAAGEDRYALTQLAEPLLSDHPASPRAYLALGAIMMHPALTALAHTLETGQPAFDAQFGGSAFDYMRAHPTVATEFAEAMTVTTRRIEQALLDADPFGEFGSFVDVGGNHGSLAGLLLERHPRVRGILFDLPEVVEEAERRWSSRPCAERLHFAGGSFFEAVPEGADLYLLKQILHDWDDGRSIEILNVIRRAIPPLGRLAIVEMVLPEEPLPHPGWMYDMLMLTMTGGRERTASAYASLLKAAGFRLERVVPTASPASVVIAAPA